PAADIPARVAAAWAVKAIEPATDALLPLVKDASVLGEDPDDELLGTALLASWPQSMSTGEALATARLPKRRDLVGIYSNFLDTLARDLSDDDLPAALDWLEQAGEVADDELLANICGSALRLAMSHLSDERAFQVVREVARRRGREFRPLLDDN